MQTREYRILSAPRLLLPRVYHSIAACSASEPATALVSCVPGFLSFLFHIIREGLSQWMPFLILYGHFLYSFLALRKTLIPQYRSRIRSDTPHSILSIDLVTVQSHT
ncbi:hypothetical protein EDC01DRAFT_469708 [Geopyxis carbonaria]|nr:hypothetical protein EDC01DRAFT_469708 [Geopyxis carbonaria]